MGSPPPSPPVVTFNSFCQNGRHICPYGIPVQFLVTSDQVANLVLSINNINAGSYSNVTSQAIFLTPNPNYQQLRVVGSNANGSTEMICSVYGTTAGENGSYSYYDENNSNNIHLPYDLLQALARIITMGGAEFLVPAANYLSLSLMSFETPPPGGAAVEGPIPCFGISIIPAVIIAQQLSTPDSPLNMIIGQNTIIQYNSDYANNSSGQGTILINSNPSTIFWGPENWA
ncbi:MAG: hypothetical protein STSR0009_19870 [Methanoregula sp.]